MITAEEFEQRYAERSKVTVEWLREQGRIVLPCSCAEDDCERWQSITRDWHPDPRVLASIDDAFSEERGFVCKGCRSWIDRDAPRATITTYPESLTRDGFILLEDGAELMSVTVYHERCSPAGAEVAQLTQFVGRVPER